MHPSSTTSATPVAKTDDAFAPIVGNTGALKMVIERARRMALSHDPILIHGATGTGKSLLSRHIHEHSPRRNCPFIEIPCSSLHDNLIESELFGHAKGAFTGAGHSSEGKIMLAAGGTLFLDEIGELSVHAQTKLLHFLQEGFFYKVGGNKKEFSNVRIIAATNRDLRAMVRAGTFRKDLYFRLAVLKIDLPDLKDRKGDVLPLALAILRSEESKRGRGLKLSPVAQTMLLSHTWPGNVRELQNALKRAAICLPPDEETIDHIEIDTLDFEGAGSIKLPPGGTPISENPTFLLPKSPVFQPRSAQLEADLEKIQVALQASQGCLKEAAGMLGVSRYTLYRRLKRLKVTKNTAISWAMAEIREHRPLD